MMIMILGLLISPALGLSVKIGSGGGQGGVSSCLDLHLDDSSLYIEDTELASGLINKNSQMKGKGENSLKESISGNDYTISNSVEGSGAMSTTTSVQASSDAGIANRKTAITGDSGSISSGSTSSQNTIMAAGGFEGEGYLSSDITSIASTNSAISGSADILGVNCLDGQTSQYLASNEIAKTVNGLHLTSSGDLGNFGFAAANVKSSGGNERKKVSNGKIVPGRYGKYNDPTAYVTAGWRWQNNPNVAFVVSDDSYVLNGEGLTASQAQGEILKAANTWDGATRQSLYADAVAISKTAVVNLAKPDGKNVQAWTANGFGTGSTALAFSATWYYTNSYVTGANGKRYNKAIESDVSYNTAYSWTTNPYTAHIDQSPDLSKTILDVQTVALHEMGHTIGLGDTYLHTTYKYDLSQIMGYYDAPQQTLGAGDITGVQKLYEL
jgi:hypothetical protein